MSSYQYLAQFYDELMGVDYALKAEYLLSVFEKYCGQIPASLIDLACGTGSLALELARRSIEVTAVDQSAEMLCEAQSKTAEQGDLLLFICQPMEELDLYGTSAGAVCTLDSINHLIQEEQVQKTFARLHYFIEPDGLFLFDVNTIYKHEFILADHSFVYETDDVFCVWRNAYDCEKHITEITLDLFQEQNGCYERETEEFAERAYTREELTFMLQQNGFALLDVLEDMTFSAPDEKSERNLYIAKRI